MRLEPQKKVSTPSNWLYAPLFKIAAFGCKHIVKMELHNSATKDFIGPAIMLGAHEGMLDFILTASAFPHRRLNFVGTEHYFRKKYLKPILNILGVISKLQFYPDIHAIKNMMRITKHGGIVAIFPAGQTSMCGVPTGIEPGIARLVQKLDVPVITACAHGSFFSKSRFNGQFARGKCEVETKILLTPEQLKTMTEAEIYAAIVNGIYYNEYEWQSSTNAKFHGKRRIQGYQYVTYKCPRCGEEYTMDCDGTRLWCKSCGNAAIVDENMRLKPETPDCKVYETLCEWYAWQLEFVKERIAKEDFEMTEHVCLRALSPKSKFVLSGEGTMHLTRDFISYIGTYQGHEYSYSMKNTNLPGLMGETGEYFEIYSPDDGPLRFYPNDGHAVAKWKQTQEYLYQSQNKSASAVL